MTRARERLIAGRAARAALLACAILLACRSGLPPHASEAVPTGPLPKDVRPLAYSLELEIDPFADGFSGRVLIDVELERPRSVLWLHGRDLEVSSAAIVLPDGGRREASVALADPTGVLSLRANEPIGPGRLRLELRFAAPFAAGLRGLYRVERGDDAYAFTQMEPIDARRAFPCFDEPAFKVPFDVSLVVPGGLVALANTPEVATEALDDGRTRHRYATTPPLPTYLLAWAVGPLDVVEVPPIEPNAVRTRALPLRGAAPRGSGPLLAHALARTPAILAEVERYTGSPYPYAKLDVVAVPDFSAGAMENVGLVTFRDGLLLIDPDTSPVHQRRAFASVMAHELAHMWFGNLVTMPWWDDIWLNESFATWLAARTIEALHPEHRGDLRRLQSTHYAMDADSLASARRIREPIRSTHDIRNAFDPITYQKGGAVLEMFEAAAGEEPFRRLVRRYLDRHAGGTATGDDFLAVVAEELGEPTAAAMRGFLDRAGLPLLEVETRCGEGGLAWRIRQRRFVPLGSTLSPDRYWGVPFCAVGDGARASGRCRLLSSPSEALSEPTCRDGQPRHPNPGAHGYFRWSLPAEGFEALLGPGREALSDRERMSLADSLGGAYRAGALPAADVLAALARLADDPVRAVATAPLGLLREVQRSLAKDEGERDRVAAEIRRLYGRRARALGFDEAPGDDGERRLLRGALVAAVVDLGRDAALRAEARERGRRHLRAEPGRPDPKAASPELLGLVAAVAVEDGGDEELEAAFDHLFASEDPIVRSRMLAAIARARDPQRRDRARALVFDERLRINERLSVVLDQAANAVTDEERSEVFAWLRAHEPAVLEAVSPERAVSMLGVVAGLCSESAAQAVEDWVGDRIAAWPGGPRRLAATLERIRLCAARRAFHRDSARAWLASSPEAR